MPVPPESPHVAEDDGEEVVFCSAIAFWIPGSSPTAPGTVNGP